MTKDIEPGAELRAELKRIADERQKLTEEIQAKRVDRRTSGRPNFSTSQGHRRDDFVGGRDRNGRGMGGGAPMPNRRFPSRENRLLGALGHGPATDRRSDFRRAPLRASLNSRLGAPRRTPISHRNRGDTPRERSILSPRERRRRDADTKKDSEEKKEPSDAMVTEKEDKGKPDKDTEPEMPPAKRRLASAIAVVNTAGAEDADAEKPKDRTSDDKHHSPRRKPLPPQSEVRPSHIMVGRRGDRSNLGRREGPPPLIDFDANTPKPEEPEAYKVPTVKKRNKRMFSALMGHLGKAKDRLAKDRTFFKKQDQVLLSAQKKQREESQRLRYMESKAARDEFQQRLSARDQLDRKAEAVRYQIKVLGWEAHHSRMQHFLSTSAGPQKLSLCWLPKTHTKKTEALLALRPKQIAADAAERKRAHDAVEAKIMRSGPSGSVAVALAALAPSAKAMEVVAAESDEDEVPSSTAAAAEGDGEQQEEGSDLLDEITGAGAD